MGRQGRAPTRLWRAPQHNEGAAHVSARTDPSREVTLLTNAALWPLDSSSIRAAETIPPDDAASRMEESWAYPA